MRTETVDLSQDVKLLTGEDVVDDAAVDDEADDAVDDTTDDSADADTSDDSDDTDDSDVDTADVADEPDEGDDADTSDDSEELAEPLFDRPSIKELKAKFPTLLKEFPQLRDSLFREAAYTRIFPTVDDARGALEDSEVLATLRESSLAGDATAVLKAIESGNKNALPKFASSVLATLHKTDSAAYSQAVTPLLENLVRVIHDDGIRSRNEQLENAAKVVSAWIFGSDKAATGEATFVKTEDSTVAKEREAFERERFSTFTADVHSGLRRAITSVIAKGLDPGKVLSSFMRQQVVAAIIDQVGRQLENDRGHMTTMAARWRRAKQEGYSTDSKDKIITAYLARARSLVPSIREKVFADATGVARKAANAKKTSVDAITPKKAEATGGRTVSNSKGKYSADVIDWKRTSDTDFLAGKVTLRK